MTTFDLEALALVEDASVYPLTLAEAKEHLRVDTADEDDLIQSLIVAATNYVSGRNGYTGRVLVQQTWDVYYRRFSDRMYIPLPPMMYLDELVYYDASSVLQTLSASIYTVNVTSEPAKIELKSGKEWPQTNGEWNAIRARYRAGYAPADDGSSPTDLASGIPAAIKAAMKLVIGDLYQNREAQALVNGAKYELNNTVKSLLDPYRVNMGL